MYNTVDRYAETKGNEYENTDGAMGSVEDELKRIGGLYQKAADWAPLALVDGRVSDRPESGFVDCCGQGTDRIANSSEGCLGAQSSALDNRCGWERRIAVH